MKTEDFELLSDMLRDRSGLVLSKDKVYLLESRLTPLARQRGLESLDDLVKELRTRRDEKLMHDVTEAMTTNESFFFRDNTPFNLFRDTVLPELLKSNAATRKIRIWCAAASTGQEPYSLAMILSEAKAALRDWRVEILATDLSQQVLEKAKAGVYSQFEVQRGLPIQMLVKYFKEEGEMWRIDAALRAMVQFRTFNLLDDFRSLGQFDVIYCRNVLIYFDQKTKGEVLDRMSSVLSSQGSLFLGAAETVLGICDRLKPVPGHRGLYRPSEPPARQAASA